ncbi:unnamed protein product [Mycena citricolor]|uniref:Uncharacterized protein n=2 Tax=Mycena citricolor TaxID=2018698 RepID=A0AAD2H9U9_9AGAR|nr:unnamed protein product [Mycena citricolor]
MRLLVCIDVRISPQALTIKRASPAEPNLLGPYSHRTPFSVQSAQRGCPCSSCAIVHLG